MSRTLTLTRKPKGLIRRNFAQGYPRSHATPTPTSRSKGQKSRSAGAGAYCGGHLAAQLVQTCKHSILKTNETSLMPIGTSGPHGKGMKWSTLGVRRSKVKVTQGQSKTWRPGEVSFSNPSCRVAFLVQHNL